MYVYVKYMNEIVVRLNYVNFSRLGHLFLCEDMNRDCAASMVRYVTEKCLRCKLAAFYLSGCQVGRD